MDIYESATEAHLTTSGLHVIFDKRTEVANIEISLQLNDQSEHTALDALMTLRAILAEWSYDYRPCCH